MGKGPPTAYPQKLKEVAALGGCGSPVPTLADPQEVGDGDERY